jgi:hypothetical protein
MLLITTVHLQQVEHLAFQVQASPSTSLALAAAVAVVVDTGQERLLAVERVAVVVEQVEF